MSKAEKKAEKAEKKAQEAAKKAEKKAERAKERERPYSVHIERRNTAVKVIIWIIVLFFVVMGAFSFATREDSNSVKRTLRQAVRSINQSTSAEEQASSLALSFVYDYYNFNPDASDAYAEKINAYTPEGVTLNPPDDSSTLSVVTASIKGIEADGKGNVDVLIQAKIDATGIMRTVTKVKDKDGKEQEKTEEQAHSTSRILTVRVPVNISKGNCAIISEPLLVADQNNAKKVAAPEAFTEDSTLSDSEVSGVRALVENYLKAYYGNDPNELVYFVTEGFGSTATVGQELLYNEIETLKVIKVGATGYEAEVTYSLTDNMVTQTQTTYLTIVQIDGMLYVDNMATRP